MSTRTWAVAVVISLAVGAPRAGFAGTEKTWQPLVRGKMPEGESKGAAPVSDGTIRLAPKPAELAAPAAPYLWAVVPAKKEVFAAGGDSGDVYRVADGKTSTLYNAAEIGVHAILLDGRDVLAATSPDGKVLRIDKRGKTRSVFEPAEKYIWALASRGKTLYVATGSPGRVYQLPLSGGNATKLFDAGEAHVRTLVVSNDGSLLAGTDGRGLLVRIPVKGKPFVIFDAPRREVSDIAVAKDGTIFFAAIGSETDPKADPNTGPKGLLYRMRPDGFAEEIWQAPGGMIYALAAAPDGSVWAATGTPGEIYVIEPDRTARRVWEAEAGQVTDLEVTEDGVLAATGNPARIVRVPWRPGGASGEFIGAPLDAGGFARWGSRLANFDAAGGRVELSTRSGNTQKPDETWSAWSKPSTDERASISSPPARYLQWKARLVGSPKSKSEPVLRYLEIFYRPENRAPVVDSITIETPGITLRPKPRLPEDGEAPGVRKANPSRKGWEPGYQALTWKASDPDGDTLVYDVYQRPLGTQRWSLLVEGQLEDYYTIDATALADGLYELRVVARDTIENPEGKGREGERVEGPIVIDTTPPKVKGLEVRPEKGKAVVKFEAEDTGGGVARAELSVDGSAWVLVSPDDGLADEQDETYQHTLQGLERGTYTVVVRVTDRSGNAAAGETRIRMR